ncbi:hypothetical protein GCM10007216_07080 [Thalassobacillus devorans]|uniref:DUF4083 domain-containing protein n=1 Tax=Thalassobacillus devorans TaxID=279813 RepID=A0ABQ1NJZ6_9BACI|nr:hypothetical protein [Thalassobacillus devorans]NIK27619.1 hypothetical protein [Thalassobacillus devorans]GGC79203.1 hypothetical protein GCM10007216_07080 [Thalassobacillus devorans]
MYLLAEGGLMVGDMLVQGLFFLILLLIINGLFRFMKKSTGKDKRLDRIEEKLDRLLKEKDGS